MLKRELNLIKRYISSTTDATLAIRITPVGKRVVMFREFVNKETEGIIILDRKLESENVTHYQEKDIDYLCRICEEYLK